MEALQKGSISSSVMEGADAKDSKESNDFDNFQRIPEHRTSSESFRKGYYRRAVLTLREFLHMRESASFYLLHGGLTRVDHTD